MQHDTLPFLAGLFDQAWRLYRANIVSITQRVMQVQFPVLAVSVAGYVAARGEPDMILVSTLPPELFAMHRMLEVMRLQGGFSSLIAAMLGLAVLYTLCHAAMVADVVNAARWAAQRQPIVAETPGQPHPYRALFLASLPVLAVDALWAMGCSNLPDAPSLVGVLLAPENWVILPFLGPGLVQATFVGMVVLLWYAALVFVPQAVVIGGCQPLQALQQSFRLARRAGLLPLALVLLAYLPVSVAVLLPYLGAQLAAFSGPVGTWQVVLGLLGTQAMLMLLLPVPHIATTLVYLRLRGGDRVQSAASFSVEQRQL